MIRPKTERERKCALTTFAQWSPGGQPSPSYFRAPVDVRGLHRRAVKELPSMHRVEFQHM